MDNSLTLHWPYTGRGVYSPNSTAIFSPKVVLAFVVALGLLPCAGCGRDMVDLKARLMMDGKPVQGAAVSLVSSGEARNRMASGVSDADGYVQFTTFSPNDGVLPGSYKVTVIKSPQSAEEELATYDRNNPEDLKRIMARERSANVNYTPTVLPRQYLNPDTSPLECTVPSESDEVVFNLDSSLGKKR
jgi:hypothetical protein